MKESEQSQKIGWSVATERYHPDFIDNFTRRFSPDQRLDICTRTFQNGMPLFVVGSANKAMFLTWINGDNWSQSLADTLMISGGLTGSPDIAGPNVQDLSIFMPFVDNRQDKRTLKPIPESNSVAVTKGQFVFTDVLAKTLAAVGCTTFETFDNHSYEAAKHFEQAKINFINLTAAPMFGEKIRQQGLLKSDIETAVGTTDFGDLNRAVPLSKYLGLPLIIVQKMSIPNSQGTERTTKCNLLYGSPKGKRIIFFDDILSSGGTIKCALDYYRKLGAEEFIICATHPVCVGNYFENILAVLKDPSVKAIITTDTLPLRRTSGEISMPIINTEKGEKTVQIISIGQTAASAADIILHAPDIKTAELQLGNLLWPMQDPYKLAEVITGQTLISPKIEGVFDEKKGFTLFLDA